MQRRFILKIYTGDIRCTYLMKLYPTCLESETDTTPWMWLWYGNQAILSHKGIFSSRKHTCYFDPLKPDFYIVKLGYTGVYIIFLISAQNIDCGYSLEPPRWGGSNEYPQSVFWAEIWKLSVFFYLKIFQFFEVKFSIYMNRRVSVMY